MLKMIRVLLLFVLFAVGVSTALAQDYMMESATATVIGTDGEAVGTVTLTQWDEEKVLVESRIYGLEPGFHAFHVHGVGMCDPMADGPFTTAMGHFNPDGTTHGNHAGDLPSLLVMKDGTAMLSFVTDRFSLADLMDDDGSAIMIHAGFDNFANIPERYGEADEATLSTGDAGARVGCGVVEAGEM